MFRRQLKSVSVFNRQRARAKWGKTATNFLRRAAKGDARIQLSTVGRWKMCARCLACWRFEHDWRAQRNGRNPPEKMSEQCWNRENRAREIKITSRCQHSLRKPQELSGSTWVISASLSPARTTLRKEIAEKTRIVAMSSCGLWTTFRQTSERQRIFLVAEVHGSCLRQHVLSADRLEMH